ncbi:MAG: hypothetical protein UR12_C0001G0018 [candidate division TM6 bacterium GW2011_GWF2_30_66]|nr:MAG: hypothetical protein UR12_C0001G0018 [candidate division TM6 bacterium GW2011_GWF2_30_66]
MTKLYYIGDIFLGIYEYNFYNNIKIISKDRAHMFLYHMGSIFKHFILLYLFNFFILHLYNILSHL